MNCYLEALSYIINSKENIKNLPYLFSWNFDFTITDKLNTIRSKFNNCDDLFYYYCGIKIDKKPFDRRLLLNYLINHIDIIIKMDVYHCNWINGYKSFHFLHYFILKGYNKETNCYLIIDPYIGDVIPRLISADIIDLYCKFIITVCMEKEIQVDEKRILEILLSNYSMSNNFNNFDYLCEKIYNSDIRDLFSSDDINLNNIIIMFNQLSYQRKKISNIIETIIADNMGRRFSYDFDDLAKKCETIKFKMMKLLLLNRINEKDKEELNKLINELKYSEIKLFNLINKYIGEEY